MMTNAAAEQLQNTFTQGGIGAGDPAAARGRLQLQVVPWLLCALLAVFPTASMLRLTSMNEPSRLWLAR